MLSKYLGDIAAKSLKLWKWLNEVRKFIKKT
jgi:hypothetical protein